MQAIILAAGLGTRLRPITDEVPKCMVSVYGIRIIDKQLDKLHKEGVNDIVVHGGYKADVLKKHLERYNGITFVENSRYAETNNMYSLYLALKHTEGSGFLLMNADVYFDANIIAGLLEKDKEGNSLIACDRSGYLEESMKIATDENGKIKHISKQIAEDEYYAVSIDVYKLNADAAGILSREIYDTIEVKKSENLWTEVALDAIFSKTVFAPYEICGRWFEIDNHDDLRRAEQIFKGDVI